MWQRVQTLYLAIACGLVAALFFCNYASIVGPEGEVVKIAFTEKFAFLLMTIMVFTANMLSLLTFKARLLQMRVCILTALLLLGFQVWLAVDFIHYHKELVFAIPAIFPLVAAILDVMAARNIMLDEAMVQEAGRLRNSHKNRKRR